MSLIRDRGDSLSSLGAVEAMHRAAAGTARRRKGAWVARPPCFKIGRMTNLDTILTGEERLQLEACP